MPAPAAGRRALVLALATAGLSAGCGFKLRQPPQMHFARITLAGFRPRSPMADALRAELARSVRVVEDPSQADVVLTAIEDVDSKIIAASTAAGQVREFRLRLMLRFRLSRPDGKVLLAPTEIEQVRDMSYTESAALAKEKEEASLIDDMRADLVAQVLRVLSAPNLAGV